MIKNVHKTHRILKYKWTPDKDDAKKNLDECVGKMKCHYKKSVGLVPAVSSQHAMTSLQINCEISQRKVQFKRLCD